MTSYKIDNEFFARDEMNAKDALFFKDQPDAEFFQKQPVGGDFFQSEHDGDFFREGDFFRSQPESDFFQDSKPDFFFFKGQGPEFFKQQGPDFFFFNQENSGENFFESDAPKAAESGHFFKRGDRGKGSFFSNGLFFQKESAGDFFSGETPRPEFFFFEEGSDSHTGEEPFFSGEFF
ncbi:uncharacterized protein LOC135500502 [Lineus longissimus]|uniref:uncharacterized protein LOC135500502 n=1 Tax=Lineus longissimus TaxID=88925 RepID=UPI002B4E843C